MEEPGYESEGKEEGCSRSGAARLGLFPSFTPEGGELERMARGKSLVPRGMVWSGLCWGGGILWLSEDEMVVNGESMLEWSEKGRCRTGDIWLVYCDDCAPTPGARRWLKDRAARDIGSGRVALCVGRLQDRLGWKASDEWVASEWC